LVIGALAAGALAACGQNDHGTLPSRSPANLRAVPAVVLPAPPPFPRLAVPALTPGVRRGVRGAGAAAAQTSFFTGEVSLSNNVYYLRFPNGTLFGFYGYYAPNPHLVYHFDLSNGDPVNGWEYVFDTPDPAHPEYAFFYDFQSAHFWYTTAALFPYLYDYSLQSWIYYFPDASDSSHKRRHATRALRSELRIIADGRERE
jgi:hypothetical protein